MRLPWELGAAAEQQQLRFHMPLLLCFPPTLPGSVAVIPAFPAPRRAVAERTNAVCDLSPLENNPYPALSPCNIALEGEEQSTSSHPKGWISSSCWQCVQFCEGQHCYWLHKKEKQLKYFILINRESFYLFICFLVFNAPIRA